MWEGDDYIDTVFEMITLIPILYYIAPENTSSSNTISMLYSLYINPHY